MWLAQTSANCDGSSSNTLRSASSSRVEPATDAAQREDLRVLLDERLLERLGERLEGFEAELRLDVLPGGSLDLGRDGRTASLVLLPGDEDDDLALQRLPGEVG